jgi:uncharacterized protein
MSLSMYEATIPAMVRSLGVLDNHLEKAAIFAAASDIDPLEVIDARLAPDMMTLAQQVQRASDNSKGGVARLAGISAPPFEDSERSFEELQERVRKTIQFLETTTPADFVGSDDRFIELKFGSVSGTLRGRDYLLAVLLPNFFFHIATAHGILRHCGLKIGKKDFFGDLESTFVRGASESSPPIAPRP